MADVCAYQVIGGLHPQLYRQFSPLISQAVRSKLSFDIGFLRLHLAHSQMSSPLPHSLHIGERPYILMGNSLVILMEYLFVIPDGKTILSMPFRNSSVTLPTLRPSNNVPLSFYYEGKPVLTNHRCYWLNVASLILGFVGNFFLLMNFTQRVRYIIALPMTIFLWYVATGLVSTFVRNSRFYYHMNLLISRPRLLKSRLRDP